MHKIIFILSFAFVLCSFAQTPVQATLELAKANATAAALDCGPAKDSCIKVLERGFVGFYKGVRLKPGVYNFITINKNFYTRSELPKSSVSSVFAYCFNNEIRKNLDSLFMLDFLRKNDSILAAYDKQGKGYRKVGFMGGQPALDRYIEKNFGLPKSVKSDDGSSPVRIVFNLLIDEKGNITEVQTAESNSKEASVFLLPLVKKLPAFIPATEAGILVKSSFTLVYPKK